MTPYRSNRLPLRGAMLAAVAAACLPCAAVAKDLPATAEGASKLSSTLSAYLSKPAAGAASPITVTPEGAHYAVTIALGSLVAPLEDSGFSLAPATLKYSLTEQDDGGWRVEGSDLPPISAHDKDGEITYNFAGYSFTGVFDPALGIFRNAQFGLDKLNSKVQSPKIQETIEAGPMHATQTARLGANGGADGQVHEEIANLSLAATTPPEPDKPDSKPGSFTVHLDKAALDFALEGAPFRKGLDLWAFLVAHPGRAELAANEPALKDLLRAVVPANAKLSEKIDAQKISVASEKGSFGLGEAKFALAAALIPGAKDFAEYRLGVDALTLPAGLLPPTMKSLIPTSADIDVKASGFDFGAAASEAINDLHLAGDGPAITPENNAKIFALMKGAAPVSIELLPSHVVAPQADFTLEGHAQMQGQTASGSLKIHARNFDQTVEALKAVGPMATPEVMGVVALAKGLGKADGDGLTWIVEYGADKSIKVNGLPLGKAP
jgi:hypothetical protein